MNENDAFQLDHLLMMAPGGVAKIAFDDVLTILYATDSFYSLIKNAAEKSVAKAPSALLRIVYSADIINVTQQLAAQKHRKDNMISINFRTLQHDGSFKWVMITGNRTMETHQSGSKTVPVYSCIAMDVTNHMLKYKRLEQVNDYHRTVTELSRELFFEYEIASDTLTFTELFHEIFGKDSEILGFRKKLEKTKLIYQDEHPAVISIFNSMMNGRKQVRFEVRLIPKDDVPVWYICYASMIFDENKTPSKVVGKLALTNPMKKDAETLKIEPVLDALTNVCTKESAEAIIVDSIAKQDTETLSALMVIDVRNYKAANAITENINGENILKTIAGMMNSQLRSTDIIGRLSMSEFVIFVKDIKTDRNAYGKAEKICKEVEERYSFEHTKIGPSVSIGITFIKGQQMDYPALLANANAALVMAKKVNNSSFEVFYGIVNN